MSDDRPETAKRLEEARKLRRFASARAAADFFGWKYDTYIQHERGERGFNKASDKYAKAFRVSKAWLLTGEGPQSVEVEVVGVAGAGGDVAYDTPIDGERDTIPRPYGAPDDTVAVEIRGHSLGPGFDGWYALYADRREPFGPDLLNQLCIVGTEDGRTLVKWVRRGRKGFNLISGNGAIEEDVKLVWAAKVIDLRPKG